MLDAMNELPGQAGDALFVPAGTLHSIGAGILLVELQEPTDLSVLLEWQRFGVDDGSEHARTGMGPRARRRRRWREAAAHEPPAIPADLADGVTDLLPAGGRPVLPRPADRRRGRPRSSSSRRYAMLVVLEGSADAVERPRGTLELHSGDNALVPHGVGSTTLEGTPRDPLPPARPRRRSRPVVRRSVL